MWSKLSNALKSRTQEESESSASASQGEVMSKVFEQHPNLSVFHSSAEPPPPPANPSPPSSPSKSGRRKMFKRISKVAKEDQDSLRAPSPLKLPIGLPKKVKSTLTLRGNGSQSSLAPSASDSTRHPQDQPRLPYDTSRSSSELLRRPSQDVLRSAQAAPKTPHDTLRRSPEDVLHPSPDISRPSQDTLSRPPITPLLDTKFGSVRSILRDPNTPGTGQNVRFFSRDAYKVISPDQSMDTEAQHQELLEPSFMDRLQHASPESTSTPAVLSRSSKSVRPTATEVFSPLQSDKPLPPIEDNESIGSPSLTTPIPPPDLSNIFDLSNNDFPPIPPGLGFTADDAPILDSAIELTETETEGQDGSHMFPPTTTAKTMTSTPYKDTGKVRGKGKGKGKALEGSMPIEVDETIFHSMEKSPVLPPPLHDRSQSFSFGQTVFFSLANSETPGDTSTQEASTPVSEPGMGSASHPSSHTRSNSSPLLQGKNRSRALSDTVFQSMIRSSPKPPEADINDESSSDLVVYSSAGEPDPFSAHANTYYTPQTMIPVTPPQGAPKHTRKTSKEENLIFSLQTQLALQTELCGQYETDLRARDELVEILGKKMAAMEVEEGKRKSSLRAWKKKVAELERACRHLEEEVDNSRQDSMERSVMDEASGEALRMLHRQIAGLEREKMDWERREAMLVEELGTLEGLVKERTEDVMQLKETLWTRDESERELKEGIREAKEQMEQMGNVSIGTIDEGDLKKLVIRKEQASEEEKARHRLAEFGWEEERAEILTEMEKVKKEKDEFARQLEEVKVMLKTKEEEFAVLKVELEAQWQHTERGTERIQALEKEKVSLEKERDALQGNVNEFEEKLGVLEVEWSESENKKNELEGEVQELWNMKDALEKELNELDEQLRQERENTGTLAQTLQERQDRITVLDQERAFALESVARLEENIRQRDAEVAEYSERIVQREAEAEQLREQMSTMKREYSRVVDEKTRSLQEVAGQEGEARMQMETLVKQKAEADVETETLKERVRALKEEVERLRRQVHELQQESADKEVKILQLTKNRSQDKEDMQGLNIALDSKQQELELLKRRLGVRGTAGSTPAQPSKSAHHRRESSAFSTPGISRPPSAMSDSGKDAIKDHKITADTPSTISKPVPLGKSGRVNAIAANFATSSGKLARGIDGSMGPPPAPGRGRVSLAGTPTPMARAPSLSKLSSKTPVSALARRVSSLSLEQSQSRTKTPRPSANAGPVPSLSEQIEKENVQENAKADNRRSMIPTPA